MIEHLYTCELLTEVILNSRIATEGNMTTLSYIPGSNFLGVVASAYSEFKHQAYDVFHSGKVQFGDALPFSPEKESFRMPISVMQPKGSDKGEVYLQHLVLDDQQLPLQHLKAKQLKQKRDCFISADGKEIAAVEKTFRLKSAHDADARRSKDEQMFGFESIRRGQTFIFSIRYADQSLINKVEEHLIGERRIGKSRTAEYGMVKIQKLNLKSPVSEFKRDNVALVYIASHLCAFDAHGMPTYEPDPAVFGISGGEIDWSRSQVRTVSWAPWNSKRNTTDTQRHAIAAGSVICIRNVGDGLTFTSTPGAAGGFQSEGLGRFLINPTFLEGDKLTAEAAHIKLIKKYNKQDEPVKNTITPDPKTALGKFLLKRQNKLKSEQELMNKVFEALKTPEAKQLLVSDVTTSQWGAIRTIAESSSDMAVLKSALFDGIKDRQGNLQKEPYLKHGVAYENIWGKDNDRLFRLFKKLIDDHQSYGTAFTARFCSEIAKKKQKKS